MGPQFFPHANGMVGRSLALDDSDTDLFLPTANYGKKGTGLRCNDGGRAHKGGEAETPRSLLPKFVLESRFATYGRKCRVIVSCFVTYWSTITC